MPDENDMSDPKPEIESPTQAETKNALSLQDKRFVSVALIVGLLASLAIIVGAGAIVTVVWYSTKTISVKLDKVITSQAKGGVGNQQQVPQAIQQIDLKLLEKAPMLGNKDAKVIVIEFADFQCPFCGIFHKETFPKFKTDYIDTGKAVFYYQDFAFLGDESQYLAEAGKCAQAQGKFWTFHDYIYENQKGENEGDYSIEKLKALAQPLGLDSAQYVQCVESRVYKPDVEAETQLGSSYGVQATPTFFVNGKKVEGAVDYSELKGILDTELNK